jgi:Zn-finger nucleic acid-binding protein
MKCPECKTVLNRRKIGDVAVDECPGCRGLWFDKDELAAVRDEIDPDLRWMDFNIWLQDPRFEVTDQPHHCPGCAEVVMQRIAYQDPAASILYCPACEGVWLDAGDLSQIITALTREADSMTAPEYVRESLREASEILNRPRDLVSEWRDLKAVLRLLSYRIFVENPKLKSILTGLQKSLPL